MIKVHLMFTKAIQAKGGELFNEIEFTDVAGTVRDHGGLSVNFKDGSEYIYPWHTLKRVRIKESVDTEE
ncbi:hypothetical protein Loshitsa2_00023 [Erwinia phage Loshitsa2]|uniref:Uncharacterized protein n=2 Tax=Micantvirus TaxID=3424950 RepID=A0AAE9FNU0_9CAUD|nr:hypothetical protein Micant_00023 [Erwinia phage Micant]UNA01151.1 hypothetical protein Loshitsa2_00023 [Erwinia phage Loshitsa2]